MPLGAGEGTKLKPRWNAHSSLSLWERVRVRASPGPFRTGKQLPPIPSLTTSLEMYIPP